MSTLNQRLFFLRQKRDLLEILTPVEDREKNSVLHRRGRCNVRYRKSIILINFMILLIYFNIYGR
ncbi:hypothetical protein PSNIH1_08330 [Pantoea sp. PSNIH1]|jgi:hypothetical protein|nr:hypothetical protein PSNIH1_08330 [Pantoea sp. PSNIH1]OIX91713.1 hypothetical protein BFS13_06915 [Pantoea sp. Ae16]